MLATELYWYTFEQRNPGSVTERQYIKNIRS